VTIAVGQAKAQKHRRAISQANGMNTPAGWYPDPRDEHLERYWNGQDWTSDTQPLNLPPRPANIRPAEPSPDIVGNPAEPDFGQQQTPAPAPPFNSPEGYAVEAAAQPTSGPTQPIPDRPAAMPAAWGSAQPSNPPDQPSNPPDQPSNPPDQPSNPTNQAPAQPGPPAGNDQFANPYALPTSDLGQTVGMPDSNDLGLLDPVPPISEPADHAEFRPPSAPMPGPAMPPPGPDPNVLGFPTAPVSEPPAVSNEFANPYPVPMPTGIAPAPNPNDLSFLDLPSAGDPLPPAFNVVPSPATPDPARNVRRAKQPKQPHASPFADRRRLLLMVGVGIVVLAAAFFFLHRGSKSPTSAPTISTATTSTTTTTPGKPIAVPSPVAVNVATCTKATTATNRLRIRSDKGDRSGGGHNFDFCPPQASLLARYQPSSGSLIIHSWDGTSKHALEVKATLTPSVTPLRVGIAQTSGAGHERASVVVIPVHGRIHTCPTVGTFTVGTFVARGATITKLYVSWSVHCRGSNKIQRGDLTYTSGQTSLTARPPR
jgi:hypothetical protein